MYHSEHALLEIAGATSILLQSEDLPENIRTLSTSGQQSTVIEWSGLTLRANNLTVQCLGRHPGANCGYTWAGKHCDGFVYHQAERYLSSSFHT